MSEQQRHMSLRVAVLTTLHQRGTQILEDPKGFLACMMDRLDLDGVQYSVIEHNCDEEFLEAYVRAAQSRSSEAIGEAAAKESRLLEEGRVIQHDVAERMSCEIAFGLANYLGVDCPERVRLTAVEGVLQETPPAPPEPPKPSPPTPGTTGTIDFSSFSTNPAIRRQQAEDAGIGMRGYEFLRWLCLVTAGAKLTFGIFLLVSGAMSAITSTVIALFTPLIVDALVIGGWYAVAWYRLSNFKSTGPKTYLWVTGIDVALHVAMLVWLLLF